MEKCYFIELKGGYEMRLQEIETRKAEIASLIEQEGQDLEALDKELTELNNEASEIRKEQEEEQRKASIAAKIAWPDDVELKDWWYKAQSDIQSVCYELYEDALERGIAKEPIFLSVEK